MNKSLFNALLKGVPAYASIASEGQSSAEFGKFFDTGSFTLNAALSGSLFGGMPDNKITVFAGESSSGKTYFVLGIIKSWMEQNPTGAAVYFDTESAVTNKMMTERGIDIKRVIKVEPTTIEEFRQSAVNILDNYEETKSKDPMIMVLDSLGNLSSLKEVTDIQEHKDSRDMTKAQLIRGAFRVLRLRLARLKVPMIVTNHVYAVVGCLTDESLITMFDGTMKRPSEVVVGDRVKTLDGPHNVTDLYQYTVGELVDITTEDGLVVSVTPNHKFLTTDGRWVRADELLVTDELWVA